MGGCFSFQISCDPVLNRVGSCFCGRGNYICNFKKNLVALHKAMEDLTATRDDVERRVQREEEIGLQRLQRVQVWLTRVDTIVNHFNIINNTRTIELERFCFCGVYSKNLKSSIGYRKRVLSMLKRVSTLKSDGDFEVVTEPATRAVVEERPLQPTIVGQETMLERAWNRLMDDGTGIMGLYGMGGVGKTTFLAQINNKFRGANDWVDIVIWVVVSSDLRVEKIQDEIAEKLGLNGEEWRQNTKSQKAMILYTSLRNKRFILLLDDVWGKVDLNEIGVPFPTRENKCKVAFTTRSQDVCGRMGVDDPMEIKCLEPNDALYLFQYKVGKLTLESHLDIPELARIVAEKCRGLPLALNVIGETMACKKTVQEWKHAIDVLSSSATDFSGMVDEILPILKYSYDNLSGEQVKSCFRYCSLFPEDYLISKEKLIDYWICEGFIEETEGREKAYNQGYAVIGTLVRACLLLEEGSNKLKVKMHDVVREMALWISSDLGKYKERCIVQGCVGLREIPKVKEWNSVRKMSLIQNDMELISGSPKCPGLTTLLLQGNKKLVNISGEFFSFMSGLLVLDLSSNRGLTGLPEQISELVSLRYLDLSNTNIVKLPGGLQELKKLIHLNLEFTWKLESISGISNLWSLKTLGLLHSKMSIDLSLVEELERLEHLEVVTIDISSSVVAEKLLCSNRLVQCFKEVDIKKLQEESVRALTLPTMVNLQRLNIECGMRDIKIEKITSSFGNKSPTAPYFSNLSSVFIRHCNDLKDLTWLLFAPNLTFLEVGFSKQLEEIISEEKAVSCVTEEGATCITVPFPKLKNLTLSNLPMLKSIYWSPLPFPCLKKISVSGCPKLRKLPLDSNSVVMVEHRDIHWIPLSLYSHRKINVQPNAIRLQRNPLDFTSTSGAVPKEIVINYKDKEWMEGFEWEDEATRLRFLPSCMLLGIF
ncbi:Disease resistance protein RPS5 [Cardamine amara subsp. amara]|uniref:Disease resistance protein RPS5 n=1 Tax=Cardamine amara subsp. amara TaxID=228776 RepID=A0ABD0ZMT5_CARAN